MFHRHQWTVTSAQQMERANRYVFMDDIAPRLPVTLILYRCECGDNKTRTVPGWWELKQLVRKP